MTGSASENAEKLVDVRQNNTAQSGLTSSRKNYYALVSHTSFMTWSHRKHFFADRMSDMRRWRMRIWYHMRMHR